MRIKLRSDFSLAPFHTGATTEQYLLCLPDGKRFQVSSKIVDVILSIRDKGHIEEVSRDLSTKWKANITVNEVAAMVERFLKPRKLIIDDDQPPELELEPRTSPVEGKKAPGMLLFKITLLPKNLLSVITDRTSKLFGRRLVLIILGLVTLAHLGTYYAIVAHHDPRTLAMLSGYKYALAYAVIIACVLWHEIGHASALRYYGASHGAIGFGLYLVFPIMYSDVSDAWRLIGRQRAIVDLGGIYFQAMTSLLLYPAYLVTRDPLCLSLVSCNDALILMSLNPLLKFDGYWLVSDLLGVPNLRRRSLKYLALAGRRLLGLAFPRRFAHPVVPDYLRFKRFTAAMLLVYGVASFTFLCFALLVMARFAPTLSSNYAHLVRGSVAEMWTGAAARNIISLVNIALRVFFQTMPILGMALMLWGLLKSAHALLKKHGLIDAWSHPRQRTHKAVSRSGV